MSRGVIVGVSGVRGRGGESKEVAAGRRADQVPGAEALCYWEDYDKEAEGSGDRERQMLDGIVGVAGRR